MKNLEKQMVVMILGGRLTCWEHARFPSHCAIVGSVGCDQVSFNSFQSSYPDAILKWHQPQHPEWMLRSHHQPGFRRENIANMFFHNKNAFSNIPANLHNQPVLKYRADIVSDLCIRLPTDLSENTVYIPDGNDWLGGLNDQIAYGQYESMKVYCSLYSNLKEVYDECKFFHPETMLRVHLKKQGIRVERFPFHYHLHPRRHDQG